MPPRIIPILARLRQDIAADLSTESIEDGCRQVGYFWRKRLLEMSAYAGPTVSA
jgi:hypothetical protein